MAKQNVPFFARFLEAQAPTVQTGLKAGAADGNTRPRATDKYPSDADEYVTLKYPSDDDEYRGTW
ncbi:MAG: microviridin/marinostatin family tricyclic proteinase inhibitor [bacterium]|nr:microviridin/marinostatin family tricyclic proteinase inhibitor [Myxococcales bacterium]